MAKKVAAVLAVLLLLIIGATFAVLKWPELLVNERALELARGYLKKQELADLTWAKGSIEVVSESLFRKRLKLKLEDVCYVRPEVVRACFERLDAEAVVDLKSFPPRLEEVGPVKADGGRFRVLPVALSGEIGVEGKAVSELKKLELRVRADAKLSAGATRARARIEGSAALHELRARLTGKAEGLLPGGGSLRVRDCDARTTRTASGGLFRLDCPVETDLPEEVREGEWRALGLPRSGRARVTAELNTASFLPDPAERAVGRVEARLVPIETSFYGIGGGATFDVDAVPLELPSRGKLEAVADFKVAVASFEKVAKRLEGGPAAVWAPLRNLTGTLELAASGKIDMTGGRVPLRLTTRLKSPAQRLDIDATGAFEFGGFRGRSGMSAELDVLLSDAQLELPRLDLAAPPRLLPDARVARASTRTQRAGVAERSLDYRIRVRTPPEKPARVLSNLAEAPVPLTLDLTIAEGSPLSGTVALRTFPVKFFNRKATIDHFLLNLKAPEPESPIDGMVKIDLTDYQFRVLATGTLGKPAFAFESDPPLSQSQILSVLIYGRAPDDLDSEESATVGNTEAAVRDQAIGLASFFILGSTPIQGLAYDPKTKALQVKFRVAEGTSLNVGTSTGDFQGIGLRRRLGKDWSITSDFTKGTGDTNVVSAFLEWAHRY